MADNYLERRMEDLRTGRPSSPSNHRSGGSLRNSHSLNLVFPITRILVAEGLSELGMALVKAFRSVDMKVAFSAPSCPEGTFFARKSGARFCPSPDMGSVIVSLEKAWGGVDMVVITSTEVNRIAYTRHQEGGPAVLAVNPESFPSETPESLARTVLLASHPGVRPILDH